MRLVHERLGLHCVLGVSNISFGLPERKHITVSFLTQAMCCGLNLPIVNPNQKEIMDAVYAFRALSGEDAQCAAYIGRFAGISQGEGETKQSGKHAGMTVEAAVLKGLKQETSTIRISIDGTAFGNHAGIRGDQPGTDPGAGCGGRKI